MVDVKLIKETITELLSANVDKETIFETLKDIGVDQGDIDKYYTEITKENNSEEESNDEEEEEQDESNDEDEEENEEESNENEEEENDNNDEEEDEDNYKDNGNTEEEINIQKQKTEISTKITLPPTTTDDLEKATQDVIDSEPELKIENKKEKFVFEIPKEENSLDIKNQLNELEDKVSDIKAQISALTKIMKDILEENRNILNKMK